MSNVLRPPTQIRLDNDTILPGQFFAQGQSVRGRGERALLSRCLAESPINLQGYHLSSNRRAMRIYQEELAWIMSDDDSWLFSFCSICHHLRLDPQWLRQCILRWLAGLPAGKKVQDQAYGKATNTPGTIGRPAIKGVWVKRTTPGRWGCFVRHEGLVYTLGAYGSYDEAERRRTRILALGIPRAVALAVAKREQEIAA